MRRSRLLVSACVLACCLGSAAFAQSQEENSVAIPRYTVLPAKPSLNALEPASALPIWNGSFTYKGKSYTYEMVGTAPSTDASTTVTTIVIPLKVVITVSGTQYKFNPAKVLPNGKTITQNTIDSPIFDFTTTYVQGGVNVGTTQYIDAYQRANFWGTVSSNPNYHVLLAPYVVGTQTITVPTNKGSIGKPFGQSVGEVDINYFDTQLLAIITKLGLKANQFPVFLAEDIYLTQGGCCIGGYHSAAGAQSYAFATYIDQPGNFAQDVSALSHEVGEWMDDPLVNKPNGNTSPCGILENGDPLENDANFGGYPYVLNGFTYNLQDLATLPYFGAPATTSVNGYFTFQGQKLRVCQNGS